MNSLSRSYGIKNQNLDATMTNPALILNILSQVKKKDQNFDSLFYM